MPLDRDMSSPRDIRPSDLNSSWKPKTQKPYGIVNYPLTGKALKYYGTLVASIPDDVKHSPMGTSNYWDISSSSATKISTRSSSLTQQALTPIVSSAIKEANATPFDILSYAEAGKHFCSLRTEYIQRYMRPILQRMLLHPKNINQVFSTPVDPITLNLPDYFQKIRYPMDLGTIKSRLQKGFYLNAGAVIADINQVFKNAMIYNAPTHGIHQLAKQMKEEFDIEIIALGEKFAKDVSNSVIIYIHYLLRTM